MKAFFALVAVVLVLVGTIQADDFCSDSKADVKIISKSTFNAEEDQFLKAYKWFDQRTANADMSSNDDLTSVANDLIAWAAEHITIPGAAFTITRSTGAILIDTLSVPPINPPIENHDTRYEFDKAILCRNEKNEAKSPIVFNHYWVQRLNATWRFYAKALQSSLDYEWFVFRINVPF